jgi:hypothetical protein
MKKRLLPCENCGKEVPLRSTIRGGPHKGKKCCGWCKAKLDKKDTKEKQGFYEKAIEESRKQPYCENCGCKVDLGYMGSSNIAHIVSKGRYKSVAYEPLNFVLLCAGKNSAEHNNCHHKFDNDILGRKNMKVFLVAKQRFDRFRDKIKEQGNEREVYENNN